MSREGHTGVTADTPKNIFFGAGTIHKGLKYSGESWNFAESCVGATNGGSTLTITPEFYDVPVDGKNVVIKQFKKKIGETATLEVNFAELTEDLIITTAIAESVGTIEMPSKNETMLEICSKAEIDDLDFWENIAFVGKTLEGKNVIAILPNALCTSGLPLAGTNREGATITATFTCHADIEDGDDLDILPWKIYYPKSQGESN